MNGFEINITEKDFRAKEQSEQNWILFQGVSSVNKCIIDIDTNGCEFARKRRKIEMVKLASAISGGAVFALGVIYIIYQLTCK